MSIINTVNAVGKTVFSEQNIKAVKNVAGKAAAPVATGFLMASGAILAANLLVPKGHLERTPNADKFERTEAVK